MGSGRARLSVVPPKPLKKLGVSPPGLRSCPPDRGFRRVPLERRQFVFVFLLLLPDERTFSPEIAGPSPCRPMPNAIAKPSIRAPKAIPKATSMVCSARPSSSKTIDKTKTMMMLRTARLRSRGEGTFAFTAASRAAREKKLAASSPKNIMNIATNRRGRKRKNLAICSCRPRIPSTLTPSRMKPSQATQKTNRLNSLRRRRQSGFGEQLRSAGVFRKLVELDEPQNAAQNTFTT